MPLPIIGRVTLGLGVRVADLDPGGGLELFFSRQRAAGPAGIGAGISEGHVHHGIVGVTRDVASRPAWVAPRRPAHKAPPCRRIGCEERLVGGRRREDERAAAGPFGLRDVAGGGDEGGELPVGHLMRVDAEGGDGDGDTRPFLRIVHVAAHQEARGRHAHAAVGETACARWRCAGARDRRGIGVQAANEQRRDHSRTDHGYRVGSEGMMTPVSLP